MNTVKKVRDILNIQVPLKDDLIMSTKGCCLHTSVSAFGSVSDNHLDCITENVLMYETSCKISDSSNDCEGLLKLPAPSVHMASELLSTNKHQCLSCEESQGGSLEVFPIVGGGSLVYWSTGLVFNTNELTFSVESLADNIKYQDKNGIVISATKTGEGCKILGKLIDMVEQLLTEWYPGLNTEQRVPCLECVKSGITSPCEFKVHQLLSLIADNKLSHNCANNHEVKLENMVPSFLFQDLDPEFLLDPKEVIYKQENETLLGTGKFGDVHHGKYKGHGVAIKSYAVKGSRAEEGFKHMYSESKFLQQLCHPYIVNMIGITIQPTMLLVMEEVPEGSLEVLLLKEQKVFPRIIFYRIAIQVASALHYLHSINIIYRDLKAANILLSH